jgi:hypothetical protein
MKYAALTLNALALLLVGYALFGVYSALRQPGSASRVPGVQLRTLPERTVSNADVTATSEAITRLNERTYGGRAVGGLDLIAVAPRSSSAQSALPGAAIASMPARNVTMLIQSNGVRTAMIDNQLVRSGAALVGGGRVTSISADRVQVREANGSQTLRLPVDRLRVGTLRSENAPNATLSERRLNARVQRAPEVWR